MDCVYIQIRTEKAGLERWFGFCKSTIDLPMGETFNSVGMVNCPACGKKIRALSGVPG